MASKPRCALNFSRVTFDLAEQVEGTLYLMAYVEDYRFEFKPTNRAKYADKDMPADHFHIMFKLYDVYEIRYMQNSCSSSLGFILRDNTILPEFLFSAQQNAPKALVDFLLFKKYAVSSPQDENRIIITVKNQQNSNQSISPETYLDPRDAVDFIFHKKVITKFSEKSYMLQNPLTLDDLVDEGFLVQDGDQNRYSYNNRVSFNSLKESVFINGLDDNARFVIWPYLLRIFDCKLSKKENMKLFYSKVIEYKKYYHQYDSLIDEQSCSVRSITAYLTVIENDVNRTDRSLDQYKDRDSPYLSILKHVLTVYGIYNPDSSYVQGMGDLISPIIILFIKDINVSESKVTMRDGSIMNIVEAEALLFWTLNGLMSLLHHDRMFTEIVKHQVFQMERIVAIISTVHPSLQKLLIRTNNSNLLFVFSSYLLLFKRDFEHRTLRIWDSFFAAENPVVFPLCFLASLLISLFPKFLLHTDGSIGEMMDITKKVMPELEIVELLNIAAQIQERVLHEENGLLDWVLLDLPARTDFIEYVPNFIKLE